MFRQGHSSYFLALPIHVYRFDIAMTEPFLNILQFPTGIIQNISAFPTNQRNGERDRTSRKQISRGIVAGCSCGSSGTAAMADTGDVHALMSGAAECLLTSSIQPAAESFTRAVRVVCLSADCPPFISHKKLLQNYSCGTIVL